MIFSSGNPTTDLYVKNLLSEIFPEFCFSEIRNITALSNVLYNNNSVDVQIQIDGDTFCAKELFGDHPNKNIATTCALGKAVIAFAEKHKKVSLPYGVLVGVRPFKIAAHLLKNKSEEECAKRLSETYLIKEDKIPLLIECAKYDLTARKNHTEKDCSIYVSIPFCPSRCSYCSFISSAIPSKLSLLNHYVDILTDELLILSDFINKNSYNLKSVYIGGGTPTVLEPTLLLKLMNTLNKHFDLSSISEFTVEAGRPDTVTEEKISILKNSGVDRVCVNCQTTNDDILKKIGRNHTREDFFSAFSTVKKYGFKTINTDIIAGLEGENFESFKRTVDEVLGLSPDSITVHTLCLKKSAKIKTDNQSNVLDTNISDFIEYSKQSCISGGYRPYYLYKQKYSVGNHENVGYCINGHESLYNIAMMNEIHTVFGAGAGATTKIMDINLNNKIEHFENYKYPTEYISDTGKTITNFERIQKILDSNK